MPSLSEQATIVSIIESGLDLVGRQAKDIIINYLNYKYGLTVDSLLKHKHEFDNYLQEILGESAGIILARIDKFLQEYRDNTTNFRAQQVKRDTAGSMSNPARKGQESLLVLAPRKRLSSNLSFIICDRCFWCATLLTSNYELRCCACGHEILSGVPLAANEAFSLDISPKRGITLSFR